MSTTSNLSPCPCCGGEARLTTGYASGQVWEHGEFHRVYCGACQLRQHFHRTPEEAVAAWNKRTVPAAQPSENDVQDLAMALAWEHACATRQADRDKEIPLEHWMQLDAWERVGFTAAANAAIKNLRPAGVLVDVAAERRRQIVVEGWTPEHDDTHHTQAEMAVAAACYILNGAGSPHPAPPNARPTWWPWSIRWWKPKSRRRDLIRAIALLVAEVERLDRATPAQESPHG